MRGLEKNDMGREQKNTQTHGHVDELVKILYKFLVRQICSAKKIQEETRIFLNNVSFFGLGFLARETVPSQISDIGKKTLSVLAYKFLLP